MKSIFFVRHGQSLHNIHADLWDIHMDDAFGLTREGVEQAISLGEFVAEGVTHGNLGFGNPVKIWSSDHIRAVQTASILNTVATKRIGRSKFQHEVSPVLREFYKVNSGFALKDFNFQDFMECPIHKYTTVDDHCRPEPESSRSIYELALDIRDFMETLPENMCHIVVSHHFTISAGLCTQWVGGRLRDLDRLEFSKMVVNEPIPHCFLLSQMSLQPETISRLKSL
jgi:broad specificity phosphatase PhoE